MGILRTNTVSGLETPTPVTGSVSFDGTGDSLTISSTSDFAFGTGDFTIEMWVYHTDLTGQQTYFGDTYGNTAGIYTYKTVNNEISLYDTTQRSLSAQNVIQLNTWHHVAWTRASGTLRAFLDGVKVDEDTYTGSFTTTQYYVGDTADATSGEMFGYISNLRVLKGTALYTENFTPPTRELQPIGDTVLLCCNNPDSAGAEATGKTITVNGNATASTFSPGLVRDFTYGTQFDGVSRFDTQGYFVPPSGNTQNRYTLGLDEIVTDGLVLHLDAGNPFSYPVTGVGTHWTDLSGNNNHGTLVNGVSYTDNNRGALVFDGVDDYALTASFFEYSSNAPISISMWFKTNVLTLDGVYLRRLLNFTNNYGILHSTTSVGWYTNGAGLVAPVNISANIWYKIDYVYTGTQHQVYLNGILGNTETSSNASIFSSLWIGSYYSSNNGRFNGNISQVSIYNKALTAQEVLQNYEALKGRYGHS